MAGVKASKLYTPQLLGLAASLANYPLGNASQFIGDARSRTCGSSIELAIDCREDGAISRIGMQVTACAIGQASAAIMAADVQGRSAADIVTKTHEVERWLSGGADMPDWPGFDALTPALEHPARHGALMLVWKAASNALSSR